MLYRIVPLLLSYTDGPGAGQRPTNGAGAIPTDRRGHSQAGRVQRQAARLCRPEPSASLATEEDSA